MSHNKVKICNQDPDSTGNVTVGIEHLTDTSISSLTNNDILSWNGTAWANGPASSGGGGEYIQIGRGEDYASFYPITHPGAVGRVVGIHDTSPKNTIPNATVNNFYANDAWGNPVLPMWKGSVTLPAGKYLVMCQTKVAFTSSGYYVFSLQDSSGNSYTPNAIIGDNTSAQSVSDGALQSTINCLVDLSSTTELFIKTVASSNVSTNQQHHVEGRTGQSVPVAHIIDRFTYLIIVKV